MFELIRKTFVTCKAIRFLIAIFVCLLSTWAAAQSQSSGALAGIYAPSVNDGVDIFSGKLANMMPLIEIEGRGEVKAGLYLPLRNLDWTVFNTYTQDNGNGQYNDYYEARLAPKNLHGILGSVSLVSVARGGYSAVGKIKAKTEGITPVAWSQIVVTGIEFISNDGSVMQFRDVVTDGQPLDATARGCHSYLMPPPPIPQECSRGRVFRSTKGENAIFVADSDVYDYYTEDYFHGPRGSEYGPSGTLYLSDGTKIIFGANNPDIDGYNINISRIVDRNGNYFDFEYSANCPDACPALVKITDSINREITISYGSSSQASFYDSIRYKGFGGSEREIKINYTSVENSMLPGRSLTPIFPGVRNICEFPNPPACPGPNYGNGTPATSQKVLYSITLPNNSEYRFYYNEYLELARIKNPLGAFVEYVYSGAIIGGEADGYFYYSGTYSQSINRRVASVRTFDESGVLISQKNFSQPVQYIVASQTRIDNVGVEVSDGLGSILGKSRHYFYGLPGSDIRWQTGKEHTSEVLDPLTEAVLRRTETTWSQRESFQWCEGILYYYACDETNFPGSSPNVDPRVTEVKLTLETGQVTKKTFDYDEFNNITDTYEYDYGNGQPGNFLRRSHTDYVTDSNYISHTEAHLKRLPLQTWISSDINGANKSSVMQFEYDNYSINALIARDNVAAHDSANYGTGNTTRGNPTKITSYAGAQNQTGAVSTQTQFDILGNLVKTIDANGNISVISYNDNFGLPDSDATTNTPPSQLNGLSTFAFPTSTTNPLGWTHYIQYDYFTRASVNTQDVNGMITKTLYDDILDRATQTFSAVGTAKELQSSIVYDDANRRVEQTSDLSTLNDNLLKSESFYDGLGRTFESRTYKDSGYIAVNTEYDALGRAKRVTNPYRPDLNEPQLWTESFYDALGRMVKVRTPDNAELLTEYSGTLTTITDQAGRKRRGITNALSQLIRVDEPDANGNLGTVSSPVQPTHYYYNTLGKMIRVNQGVQNRYFMYDSLGRLLRVRQPEQEINATLTTTGNPDNNGWTAGFSYDNNGNVLTATDANGITITNTYDALNRLLTMAYSDGTPTVTHYYDGDGLPSTPPFSRGKLTRVASSVSESRYTEFDLTGRLRQYQQITDGQTYTSKYTYNLSGALIEEEYPSGRVVRNEFDEDGHLTKVESMKAGTEIFRPYASNFGYNAVGMVTEMRYGNGRWETTKFNSRFQVTELGLGSSATDSGVWKTTFEYGELETNGTVDTAKNSGNIARQTLTVPGTSFVQSYKYDSLYRLTEAKETTGGSQNWVQNWSYDRYGNRIGFTQDIAGNTNVTNPTIDPNTNRFASGQGFSYDKNGNIVNDIDPLSSLPRQFIFNGDNKQVEVQRDGVTIGRYFYDGEGKRVKKVADTETTIFVYSAGKLIAEYSTQLSQTPSVNYTTTDHLGSPRIITDELGQVKARRDFLPFGEELYVGVGGRTGDTGLKYSSGEDDIRQKFTGYQKDTETDLDFAEARMYETKHGRFTTVDPLLASGKSSDPQTFNRYVYVLNNPTVLTDPSGQLPEGLMYGWFGGGSLIGIGIPNMSQFMTIEEYYTVTRTTQYSTTAQDGNRQANITVSIAENLVMDRQGQVVVPDPNPAVTTVATSVGSHPIQSAELRLIETIVTTAVTQALKSTFPVPVLLAILKTETQFGILPNREGVRHKESDINPGQFSASSGLGRAVNDTTDGYSTQEAREINIGKVMQHWNSAYVQNGKTLNERFQLYNSESRARRTAYANRAEASHDNMAASRRSPLRTSGRFASLRRPTSYPVFGVTPCRVLSPCPQF